MYTYFKFLTHRYLGQKGQGIVEYAVILAVVVAIGVALSTGTFTTEINALYTSISTRIHNLIPTT